MYRHDMVFTGDRSSGIGCSRPRRRVFVVHAEISGTLVRVRVPSKSIFILFFPSLFLSTRQILSVFYSIVADIVDWRAIRFPLFGYLDGNGCFTCVIERRKL